MNTLEFTRKLPVKRQYDVIVAGGGLAGCAAAYSVAKNGNSVLLLEKSTVLGGLGTMGLINLLEPLCNGAGKQIIFGLAEKWRKDCALYGWDKSAPDWANGEPTTPTNQRCMCRYSYYIFALQLVEQLSELGVDILFDCQAADAVTEGNICVGVVTSSKSGLEFYGCKTLIDVTGDCDMLRRMGVPTVAGENYFTYLGYAITLDSCREAADAKNIAKALVQVHGGGVNLFGDGQPDNIPRWSGLTVEEVTDYLITNQKALLENLKKTDRFSRDLVTLPMMPQFRTTCHINGDYTLKLSDCYRHFDDSVGAICDFAHRGHLFEVPLRTLVHRDYDNVITAGRSAAATGYAWDILRVIGPAIQTGQAAGEVACMAVRDKVAVANVDIARLQKKLEAENVMIHFPDSYIPEDRTVIIRGKAYQDAEDHL